MTATIDCPPFVLRPLLPEDVTSRYLEWLHDAEVTRFLESQPPESLDTLRQWVASFDGRQRVVLGIFAAETKQHVGNITFYNIQRPLNRAHFGYMIGERQYWGSGAAAKALSAAFDFGFGELGLEMIEGGVDVRNVHSLVNLRKLGFSKVRTIQKVSPKDGQTHDINWFELQRADWLTRRARAR